MSSSRCRRTACPRCRSGSPRSAQLPTTAYDRTRTRKLDVGVFSTLDNLIDTQTGTVKAKARFPNGGGTLFPNQFVNVSLLLHTISGAIVVPVIALRHGPNGDFVYVVNEDQTVALRPVTRGEATVDVVVITSGLAAGERVVTEGGDRLKDGARVQTRAAGRVGGFRRAPRRLGSGRRRLGRARSRAAARRRAPPMPRRAAPG